MIPGTRIAHYEIAALIGAGGMGEVYRARDTKLNRDVAIKVLPRALSQDPARMARFTREAQTLALLNHPNIAQIHGFEESASDADGIRGLVMELVDGEDLAAVTARGPLPVPDAVTIARQIADALAAAHELGIVHRDLKPANVMVRADGVVKVLDFGLAKASGAASDAGTAAALANSPTITSLDDGGSTIILGTAAYMSPEQASRKVVDKRSDIWAFGVVFFEMLTGRRLFDGPDAAHVIASVLKSEPDWSALPSDTPRAVRQLLQRCLEKDCRRRLDSASHARLELEDVGNGNARDASPSAILASTPGRRGWLRALPWLLTAALGSALAWTFLYPRWPAPGPPSALLASVGADVAVLIGPPRGSSVVMSPDGTVLVFAARPTGERDTRLYQRRFDQLTATAMPDTEGAINPFFSPDGKWVAFFADQKLKRVPVDGGASVTLCATPQDRGGTWTVDGTIIFSDSPRSELARVSAAGGTPTVLVPNQDDVQVRWPVALPDGKTLLYTRHVGLSQFDSAELVVMPLSGGAAKVVLRGGYFGRYAATNGDRGPGHLLFIKGDVLFAIGFDLERLETIGQPVPILRGIATNSLNGGAHFDVSADGTLVYVPGPNIINASTIDWMTRDGTLSPLRRTIDDWANPAFSPDGTRLAIDIVEDGNRDVWVYDWTLDTINRVTFDEGADFGPVWTPDGKRIAFASDRAERGVPNLYWVSADGTGEVQRLTTSPHAQQAYSWHPSGRFLSFHESRGAATRYDAMILPMEGDAVRGLRPGAPFVFVGSPNVELTPVFSPDGRWIAYVSDESLAGTFDTYVRSFPLADAKWRISALGGNFPRWSPHSNELVFFTNPTLTVVPYTVSGDTFRPGRSYLWAPRSLVRAGLGYENGLFALHPDGKRLALAPRVDVDDVARDHVVVMSRFFDELRTIAPVKR